MFQKQKWFYSDQKEKVWTSFLKQNQMDNNFMKFSEISWYKDQQ